MEEQNHVLVKRIHDWVDLSLDSVPYGLREERTAEQF
jgi:hypothetical protein